MINLQGLHEEGPINTFKSILTHIISKRDENFGGRVPSRRYLITVEIFLAIQLCLQVILFAEPQNFLPHFGNLLPKR